MNPTPYELARDYLARGLAVLPVEYKGKRPSHNGKLLTGWQHLRLTADDLSTYFNGHAQNIGVVLGEASGRVVDADLDCPEAVMLAPEFLPPTGAIFGRTSRRRSHYLYYADLKTRKFCDPLLEKGKDEAERDKAMLVELRSTGTQTVFPGSVHESGEAITWDQDQDPESIEAVELERAGARLAAACLLTRYWPAGARNDTANALAGGLLRAGWSIDETAHFIEAVCRAAQDEETRSRVRTVVDTAAKLQKGSDVTGWPSLAKIIDKRIVARVCEWLEVQKDPRIEARSRQWDAPEELPDDLLPVPAFDARLLPEALRGWIEDISERMQCPMEFPSVAAVIAAGSLIGNTIRIRPKREDDWTVTPNLWGGIVAKPGFLKTPTLNEALKPLRARERLAHEEYKAALEDFEFQQMQREAQRDQLKKDIRDSIKQGRDGSEYRTRAAELQVAPPTERRYEVNDPTVEKLGELLNLNARGLMLFRDELAGWFKSLDREGREQDRTFFLETWTGSGSYTYDRIGRGTLRIENLTVSILGGIQPGPLMQYLRGTLGGGHGDDGLMQRFQLLVYPDPPKEWRNVDRAPDAEAAARAHECFARLDTLDPEIIGAQTLITADGADMYFLRFEADAQEFFDDWRADLETGLHANTYEHPALEGYMSKYRSLLPSLALIFHLIDRVSGTTSVEGVTLDATRRAAAWCSLLEKHARRIYGLALNAEFRIAKIILERIRRGDLEPEFTARDIYRKQWAGLSKPADVIEPLRILEDYGWLRSVSIGGGDAGGRPSTCYLAHPSLIQGGSQ